MINGDGCDTSCSLELFVESIPEIDETQVCGNGIIE